VSSLLIRHEPCATYRIIGGGLYLIGTILVTIVFNVPRNDALAAVDPAGMMLRAYGPATSRSGRLGIMCEWSQPWRGRHFSQLRFAIDEHV
jgi:hypothetical protein